MAIKVLLAEDHNIVREGIRLILESNPEITIVGEAADGIIAVQEAERLNPDVIVMDLAMPNMNGIEACRKIIESDSGAAVLMLSMYGTHEDIYRALKAGALGYLLKESLGKELVNAVITVASGSRYLSKKVDDILISEYIKRADAGADQEALNQLSGREREVLQLIAEGKTSAEIAGLLFLSAKTVDTYRSRIMSKLGLKNMLELIKFAIRQGITH